jgi:hypothetical protein
MHTSLLIPYFSFPWAFPSHRFYVLINYQNRKKRNAASIPATWVGILKSFTVWPWWTPRYLLHTTRKMPWCLRCRNVSRNVTSMPWCLLARIMQLICEYEKHQFSTLFRSILQRHQVNLWAQQYNSRTILDARRIWRHIFGVVSLTV